MCEDCAAAAAPGKALLSWMGRSELGERDLACACCGVALESGFYSPPFLLPKPELPHGLDCSLKEGCSASGSGDLVFVSEEGPVIELFDEKPLVEDDSIGVVAQNADIAANVERLVPLESIDFLAVSMPAVSSQSPRDRNEVMDHGDVRREDVVQDNTFDGNEEKSVMNYDDNKVDGAVDRQIAATVLAPPCMEGTCDDEINASETMEGFAAQQVREDSELKDNDTKVSIGDDICENEHVELAALQHDSCTVPTEHKFIEKLDRSIEMENVEEAKLNHKLVSTPMEADVLVSSTSYEIFEDNLVQQTQLNHNLDILLIHSSEHADQELEGDKTAEAALEQEGDPVTIHSGQHVCVSSDSHNDDEHAEVKQKSPPMTAEVLDCVANTFDDDTNTGKDDMEDDPAEAALTILDQTSYEPLTISDKLSPDYSVTGQERAPDTPNYIESTCDSQELLDSKVVISDTKSTDSSCATVSSDLESTELVSIDQLKTALAAARKSLNTLYAELENERNAAAISADETMAMINRLQEQKAAMQMEAIQYQRLMEEQSEYDQEALQRLNELVVKREKEKQDLERELELYRHKVHLYEAKMRKMSRHKADDQNGSSSASSSAEDSDDLSQSFYEGDESAHGLNGSNGSIPTDVVLHETARHLVTLDGSLADFEEERLSILEQLKVLEDRLFDLDDEESEFMKTEKHLSEEKQLSNESNGFSDDDSCLKLQDKRKGVSYKGKKLLPLFDDASVDAGNLLTKQVDEVDHSAEVTLELAREQDKLAIASEIDLVHERLHALEADRDFIKQCVGSLKRGGKGFDLLQEILQHLRDLRRIEQHTRNSGQVSPHYLHPYVD